MRIDIIIFQTWVLVATLLNTVPQMGSQGRHSALPGSRNGGIVHLTDGFPMPVCVITRASRNRCFSEAAAYGYCASKDEYDYGFEGHLVVSSDGVVCG
jgi:hypothetical protein